MTNEDKIKRILEELHTVEIALLTERILLICKGTREAIKENPEDFNSTFVYHTTYDKMCEKVIKIIEGDV